MINIIVMQIHVYDTWVKGTRGTMHFDVYLPEKNDKGAIKFAKEFVNSLGEKDAKVTSNECSYCHSQGTTPEIAKEIEKNGYYIFKMSDNI